MRCPHTGLPSAYCAHCNGVGPLEKPEFSKYMIHITEAEPRLKKGRGTAEWVGRGESLGTPEFKPNASGHIIPGRPYLSVRTDITSGDVNPLGLSKGSCIRHAGFSQWARDNTARSLTEAIKTLGAMK